MAAESAEAASLDERGVAASRVAAMHRGNVVRRQHRESSDAASKLAAAQRGRAAREKCAVQKSAAGTIQRQLRGHGARRRVTSEKEAYYYTPDEVALHDRADNLWVSLFHRVLDLSSLVEQHRGPLAQPLIEAAGCDVSHWFDAKTRDVRTHIDAATGLELPYLPMGRFVHVPPAEPDASWSTAVTTPWWKDASLVVGRLTKKTRKIKLLNVLTRQENILDVCAEESIAAIQRRYTAFNSHVKAYVWKRTDHTGTRVLDMAANLEVNGIPDEADELSELGVLEDFIPLIHLYFADDLTVA